MCTFLFTIYIQNWKTVRQKIGNDTPELCVQKMVHILTQQLGSKHEQWNLAHINHIEYVPNYATPMDYREYLDNTAWSLWSSARFVLTLPTDVVCDQRDIEKIIENFLGTNIHLEITREEN